MFSRPETGLLNKSLRVVLKSNELPIVSGVSKQDFHRFGIYKTSEQVIKNGVNLNQHIYTILQKRKNPDTYLSQKFKEIALGLTEEWEQGFNNSSLIAPYGEKLERPTLLARLQSGSGSAIDYSKLITSRKPLRKELEINIKKVVQKGGNHSSKIRFIPIDRIKKLSLKTYKTNTPKTIRFTLELDAAVAMENIALFLENIPPLNNTNLANIVLPTNSSQQKLTAPNIFTSGKLDSISYTVPEKTFLSEIKIYNSQGISIFSSQEILPDPSTPIPFSWDGTANGKKLPEATYQIEITHKDKDSRVLSQTTTLVSTTLSNLGQTAKSYYLLPPSKKNSRKKEFVLSLNKARSGAFKIQAKVISAKNNQIQNIEESIYISLAQFSKKHSSFYYSNPSRGNQPPQLIVSLKDNQEKPIAGAFVKIIGDQGFSSNWLQTNHNGLAIVNYTNRHYQKEGLVAFSDLLQINNSPLWIKGI